ncbi:hypothetical protein GOP47_0016191 [Adiantum capillus-veneris]|uniref:Uncharacterized protein n=1 Tax=Adiantum capillus-veneris TaxID=13818 RepID=A0A9D4UIB1_ADICA|nr:hypothetical protein GOP47_0016191 [Adiantum capillus-veneris]
MFVDISFDDALYEPERVEAPSLQKKIRDNKKYNTAADFSPLARSLNQSSEPSPHSKKLSPRGKLNKASSSAIKKAFLAIRGKASRCLADTSFSSPLIKNICEEKDEPNAESFTSQLAITPS